VTGQNSEQASVTPAGTTRLHTLRSTLAELDCELEELARGVSITHHRERLDASSLMCVDEVLSSLEEPKSPHPVLQHGLPEQPNTRAVIARLPSIETPLAIAVASHPEDTEIASAEAKGRASTVTGIFAPTDASPIAVEENRTETVTTTEESELIAPSEHPEEDVPLHLPDLTATSSDNALATILDVSEPWVGALPGSIDSQVPSSTTTEEETSGVIQSSSPRHEDTHPLESLSPSTPPTQTSIPLLEGRPEANLMTSEEMPALELGSVVESMLIDEDAVIVETAASSTPSEPAIDTSNPFGMGSAKTATGTFLGVAPSQTTLESSTSVVVPTNDLGEIVFDLEPELEIATSATPSFRPVPTLSSPPASRERTGLPSPTKPSTRPLDSPDNLELDLSDLLSTEGRPPSLRPPPLLPPPPGLSPQRSVPPPVPRVSKPRVQTEEIIDLEDEAVEVARLPKRPTSGGESKTPPPVPQRPGGQK
jgi:hypothetical protein